MGNDAFVCWQRDKWTTIQYDKRPVGLSARFLQESFDLCMEQKLSRLNVPTLLFQGQKDAFISADHSISLVSGNPKVRAFSVPDCGHPFLEPDAIRFFGKTVADAHSFLGLGDGTPK
jgi:pimeloyl-ACP methyl ester carboxylesterase